MKKLLTVLLALGLLLSLAAPALAAEETEDVVMLSRQSLMVDGKIVECEKYNINGNNFFKLRDLAMLLSGTGSQFDVGWDEEKGIVTIMGPAPYSSPNGEELTERGDLSATAVRSPQKIMLGNEVRDDLTVWNIGGSNFFMLRELGKAIGFIVDYEPVSNTAIVQSLPELPGVMLVSVGEKAIGDMNGDGVDNTVRVWLERNEYGWNEVRLSIDGVDFTDAMIAARNGNEFDDPDEFWWIAADLDPNDEFLEFAIQDWGPSDDLTTSFFRYDGQTLSCLGSPEGFIFFQNGPATMTLNGDGTLRSELRLSVLQTWWTMVDYAIGSDGKFAPVPQDFYTSTSENQQAKLLVDLYVWDQPDGTRSVLPAGTTAQIVGTDNVRWVLLRLADGSDAWLDLGENGYSMEGPDGVYFGSEALEGLNMAD